MAPWLITLLAGLGVTAASAAVFRGARSRLIAIGTLSPLVALATVLVHVGEQGREEEAHVQDDPTIFGDGSHSPGASHAAQTGVAAESGGPAHGAEPAGPSIEDLGKRLTTVGGLSWPDPGTVYTVSSLWNRIDGGAELYKKHGMKRAIFATARFGEADIEVQLFDMGTPDKATGLFDATDRDSEAKPLGAGDRGVLWRGGGELVVGRVYGRIIISTAPDDPKLAAIPEQMMRAMAGSDSAGDAPAAPSQPAEPTEDAAPAAKTPTEAPAEAPGEAAPEAPGLADRLGVGAHLIDFYGIKKAEGGDGKPLLVTLASPWNAAAWGPTNCDEAEIDPHFGCDAEGLSVRVRGSVVVIARGEGARGEGARGEGARGEDARGEDARGEGANGEGAKAAADAAAAALEGGTPPGTAGLAGASERRAQVGGWSGRKFLGGVVIGLWEDESEVFIAHPKDPADTLAALKASFTESRAQGEDIVGVDEYQGDVLFGIAGDFVVGVAGAESVEKAAERLAAVRKALQAP